jgi:hypothetical protein
VTARTHLDRKTRWTIGVLIVLLVAIPVLAVRSYIARVTAENVTVTPESVDERLVSIGGHKTLIQPGALADAMSEWLKTSKEQTFEFELSDRSFARGSAEATGTTEMRISQVMLLTKSHPALMVHILLPRDIPNPAGRQLDQQRAERLRDELVSLGLNQSHVTIGSETEELQATKSPHLAILLSKNEGPVT